MANRRYLPRNCSYIEEQNEQRTEELCTKVKLLKHIAIRIGEETKSQNVDLTRYQKFMDLTNSLVGQTRQRVMLLSRSGSWKMNLYLMGFSLCVFFDDLFFN